mmetsp:Transcript_11172/g.46640  ORF Transcript_11172/g.46640 Transcript_11172/m.46640 type:complete len:104 (-) Transcript_11172:1016-1327(-)
MKENFRKLFSEGGHFSKIILDALKAGIQGVMSSPESTPPAVAAMVVADVQTLWNDLVKNDHPNTITDVVQKVVEKPMQAMIAYNLGAETCPVAGNSSRIETAD